MPTKPTAVHGIVIHMREAFLCFAGVLRVCAHARSGVGRRGQVGIRGRGVGSPFFAVDWRGQIIDTLPILRI